MTVESDTVRDQLLAKRPKRVLSPDQFLSLGWTLGNLAASGNVNGGIPKGSVVLFPGDPQAGKSFVGRTCLAEASISPYFKNYQLVSWDVERGALMDQEFFFGKKLAQRLDERRDRVHTLEKLWKDIVTVAKKGPFVGLVDSVDPLPPEEEAKKAGGNGNLVTVGSRARTNSAGLRIAYNAIVESGSILILLYQSRDKIPEGWSPNPRKEKTHGGGYAPTFYSQLKLWFAVKGKLSRKVMGQPERLGTVSKVHCERTRLTGRDVTVPLVILNSLGVDDVGTTCRWLVERGHWKRKAADGEADKGLTEATPVKAPELDYTGPFGGLVEKVIETKWEKDLRHLAGKVWKEIDDQLVVDRKPKYQ